MIWAVVAGAVVFFALGLFSCFLAGLLSMAAKDLPAPDLAQRGSILLEHRGEVYPVDDIWDAITVSRILARLDKEKAA